MRGRWKVVSHTIGKEKRGGEDGKERGERRGKKRKEDGSKSMAEEHYHVSISRFRESRALG